MRRQVPTPDAGFPGYAMPRARREAPPARAALLAGLLLLAACGEEPPPISRDAAIRACLRHHHVSADDARTKITFRDHEVFDVWISTARGAGDCTVERKHGEVLSAIWTGHADGAH